MAEVCCPIPQPISNFTLVEHYFISLLPPIIALCLRPVFDYSQGRLFKHKSLKIMMATSYLGSAINLGTKIVFQPFPIFSEAAHCIHLEEETYSFSSSSSVLYSKRKNHILQNHLLWISSKSHLGLQLLGFTVDGWVRTIIRDRMQEEGVEWDQNQPVNQ